MKLKYIITDKDCFALFSETAVHANVARGLFGKPVGAGFATVAVGYVMDMRNAQEVPQPNVHCFGESISLGIRSREEDEKIINEALNNHYY